MQQMTSARKESTYRRFRNAEKEELTEYLLCNCSNCLGRERGANNILTQRTDEMYAAWIKTFIQLINQNNKERNKPRIILRKLWKSNALPKCVMNQFVQFVLFSYEFDRMEPALKECLAAELDSINALDSAKKHIEKLHHTISREDRVFEVEGGVAGSSTPIITLVDLARQCIESAIELENIKLDDYSLSRNKRFTPVIKKMVLHQAFFEDIHAVEKRVSPLEISLLLPTLHEAIAGTKPSTKVISSYKPENLAKEAKRLLEEANLEKMRRTYEHFYETCSPHTGERTQSLNFSPNAYWLLEIHRLVDIQKKKYEAKQRG